MVKMVVVLNQPQMCFNFCHPFLHESPTILTPFLKRTLSSFARSFTYCSNPAMEGKLGVEAKEAQSGEWKV
ncbi:hypothetical protein SLEP1_g44832 [Rubroshorea leprosula]|uniref:Uncharacterized protein n=1 Tax=Rubroshorea leprosula TaxID=152421 RepID=A0AAV5LHS7_9ROSI|nr:hypothetical protein SLEP1_g44832 [Rubroshorea leprosula]